MAGGWLIYKRGTALQAFKQIRSLNIKPNLVIGNESECFIKNRIGDLFS